MLGAQLPRDEAHQQRGADDERADDLRGGPADLVGADQTPHDPDEAGAGQGQTGQIEPGGGPAALVEPQQDERHEQRARSGR